MPTSSPPFVVNPVGTATWTDPTQNTDNSPITAGEVTGYLVGIRPASGTPGTYPTTVAAPASATSVSIAAALAALPSAGTATVAGYFSSVQTQSANNSVWDVNEVGFSLSKTPNPPSGFGVS